MLQREFLHPREHEKVIFTDASNAGWGAHSGQDSTGGLWSHPEKHQPIRNEGSFSGPTILQKDSKQSSPHRLRQHLSDGMHQQTGRHSIGRTLRPDVEKPNMVQSEQCDTQSTSQDHST